MDNVLTIQCYNYQAVQTSGMVERIIEAGPVETKMIHTKYLTSTTSGSISLHSEVKLMFHAKSGTNMVLPSKLKIIILAFCHIYSQNLI